MKRIFLIVYQYSQPWHLKMRNVFFLDSHCSQFSYLFCCWNPGLRVMMVSIVSQYHPLSWLLHLPRYAFPFWNKSNWHCLSSHFHYKEFAKFKAILGKIKCPAVHPSSITSLMNLTTSYITFFACHEKHYTSLYIEAEWAQIYEYV